MRYFYPFARRSRGGMAVRLRGVIFRLTGLFHRLFTRGLRWALRAREDPASPLARRAALDVEREKARAALFTRPL